ncbi:MULTISPECIES: class I SAM-dependent methyltransferase [Arthrobacter]|uniref:class I SAM-dependent methyltransferase n=1 Tax=unclassified Arthrobacter TaxID=235627 RepID=UPI0024B9488D|nr:methyltransferase [Arthrobacter sp. H35-MC1]MDJ0315984.1 methyltransferase [Arthrobacter sp. H35-MC1]
MEEYSIFEGIEFDFSQLRRFPDVEAENLFAFDASDELILRESATGLARMGPGKVSIVGDRYGALTLGAASLHNLTGVRVHQDSLSGQYALNANAARAGLADVYDSMPLDASLFSGAEVVLWQLPRSLEEVVEVAELIRAHAAASVQIFAGGRIKHMTLAMNSVLGTQFSQVVPGRAWHKSRPLKVSGPLAEVPGSNFPRKEHHLDLNLWLCAHGATFGGTKVDAGTRFLLDFIPKMSTEATTAIDLGSGNGTIAASLALKRPHLRVVATDQSWAAVASTAATALANEVADQIDVIRDDALESFATASAELIVLNPPFHVGATVHAGIALKLFAAAARVLAPGGELWCVYNRHLEYKQVLSKTVGPTREEGRNHKFTVTVSVKA